MSRPNSPNNAVVAELVQRIQAHVFPRRVRVKEFFNDYDPLRCGRCTRARFTRAVNLIGARLTDQEAEILAGYFTETGPAVQKPQDISYHKFCEAIDEVFVVGRLEKQPGAQVPLPGSSVRTAFAPQPVADEARLDALLHRVALLAKSRRVVLKYCFQDCERADSTSLTVPRRSGKVTVSQFCRFFPFTKDIESEELMLLIERYKCDSGDINFQALHDDVTEMTSTEPPPFPTSDLHLKPDPNEWTHQNLSSVAKLQSKVVEKRARLFEHFQDFDALRKGFCTIGQVRTVFTILGLEVSQADFDSLVGRYIRDDGMFWYATFCDDIDQAFTRPGLEKDPTVLVTMPDPNSTAPARRNRINLSPENRQRVADLQDKIRSRTQVRRILLKPAFQDMDRTARGHCTRGQFSRIMHMLSFELDERDIDLLASVYCDLGNHHDFNYADFCRACDPPNEEEEIAMLQATSAFQDHQPSKYFDGRGQISRAMA